MTARPLVTDAMHKQTTPTNEPIVNRPSLSMVCAGCDGDMVITKDAIGRERLRCPTCHGVSKVRPHRDDAQLPQGLVSATDAPIRVVREIVRVTVQAPALPPVVELPPIRAGQLRCQRCARGTVDAERFCREASCLAAGRVLMEAFRSVRVERRRRQPSADAPSGPRRYGAKACAEAGCAVTFQPSGPAAKYCEAHR